MAKMFYTLEEAAQRLDVSEEEIKQLASSGKLQQFRDRDKLMFKRDQIDSMATEVGTTGLAHVVDEEEGGPVPLEDTGKTDAISLADTDLPEGKTRKEDPRERTGVSVFDADEVETADPSAQTQVTQPTRDDEELVLESVGSGSGLLDLTRESDDTSLGAELLEEIYPGSGEGSDTKLEPEITSSSGLAGTIPESGASGLENLQPSSGVNAAAAGGAPSAVAPVSFGAPEAYDPAGNGFGAGLLLGTMITLIIALIVAVYAVQGVRADLTEMIHNALWMWVGILFVGSLILGGIGFAVGKAMAR